MSSIGDGTYIVFYTPEVNGHHRAVVTIQDKPIMDSPFTILVVNRREYQEVIKHNFFFQLQLEKLMVLDTLHELLLQFLGRFQKYLKMTYLFRKLTILGLHICSTIDYFESIDEFEVTNIF